MTEAATAQHLRGCSIPAKKYIKCWMAAASVSDQNWSNATRSPITRWAHL